MANIHFFLSKSDSPNHAIELRSSKNGKDLGVCNRWPYAEQLESAIGMALITAIQSKNDYGNNVKLTIEIPVCSIDGPTITI